jgi:hypothetical protein
LTTSPWYYGGLLVPVTVKLVVAMPPAVSVACGTTAVLLLTGVVSLKVRVRALKASHAGSAAPELRRAEKVTASESGRRNITNGNAVGKGRRRG